MARGPGRPKKIPKPSDLIRDHLPVEDIFDEKELEIYNKLVDIYLKDFEDEDLNSNDMDDIINLALNRVMEFRLLKESKGSASEHINVSASIEKLRKHNAVIKDNLFARRKDRIDPNKYKGYSIIDLVASFDEERAKQLNAREAKLQEEEKEILKKRKDYKGNKDDKDRENKGDIKEV
jgi:hypothetical protein